MSQEKAKFKFHLGIRQKVLLSLMLVLLTSLSLSGWLGFEKAKENITQEVELRGSNIIRFLSKSLVYSVVGYDYHTIDLLLNEITHTDGVGYARVSNLKNKTMGESGTLITNDPKKMVVFTENLLLENEVVGLLTVGVSTERIYQRLETQKYNLIKREAILILLISLGEFFALSYIVIRPVDLISKSIHEHGNKNIDGELLGTIPITSNDEFGELAAKFNILSNNLNMANTELQSRVDYANNQLIKTNNLLLDRSKELMDLNEEFKNLSITDSLTGLYNRRHFKDVLHAEIELSKRHGDVNSLLVVDIDHFKKINDKYGHSHGDSVIQVIAEIMRERFRETDVLCRIGGEEFVAICKRADKVAAIKLAESLRKAVEEKNILLDGYIVNVTVSIGISTVMAQNIDLLSENWFKFADTALYFSKDKGRNRVTHHEDIEVLSQKLI